VIGPVEASVRLVRGRQQSVKNTATDRDSTTSGTIASTSWLFLHKALDMQSSFFQTINALLQQVQPSQPLSTPTPQTPSIDVLQRQLLQSIQTIDHNTIQQPDLIGLVQALQQRQMPQSSSAPSPSSQLISDALKMIAPVGQSPNDEQLLIMALHTGLSQGLNHRRAIETLHGVGPWLHLIRLPLILGSRSTTTPLIYGKIIISNINYA
jgi:hypothetical protein